MRPEAKKIQKEQLPKWEGNIPHIKRVFSRPPGLEQPEMLGRYGLYLPDEVDEVIKHAKEISDGGKKLLKGLLEKGGAALFGSETNYDLGLNYSALYKTSIDDAVMVPVMEELAQTMNEFAKKEDFPIHAVVAPEMSGIPQGRLFASFVPNVECHPIKKNSGESVARVAVDSYTKGKTDILSLASELLETFKTEGRTNIVLSDDIIDAGIMTQAVGLLFQLAQEQGYDIHLVGIVSPIEKTYTGAREIIQERLGDIPLISALQIEDIGILSDTQGWIKVKGISRAIPCNLADFRIK